MDLIVQLPKTRSGYDAIVVFVDKLSKMVHYSPCTTTITAPELAFIFMRDVFKYHGMPKSIVSDRDSKFTSLFWKSLWKQCGTALKLSTSFHPQTDGQTERANRTLEDMLRAYVNDKHNDWDLHLPTAEFAVNNSIHASTGYSPFYMNYGQHPHLPSITGDASKIQAVETLLSNLKSDIDIAKQHLISAQQRQKHYADQHRREVVYKQGDKVLLNTKHLHWAMEGPANKLRPKFIGPFIISQVVSPVAYRLTLPHNMQQHPVFHVSNLKSVHISSSFNSTEQQEQLQVPAEYTSDGDALYEVEKIVAKRRYRNRIEYLVKWKNYDEWNSSWESINNIKDTAPEAIRDFERHS